MESKIIELSYKPLEGGEMTYKQLRYIRALESQHGARVGGLFVDNTDSWLCKNVPKRIASQIIDLLKGGYRVELRYPAVNTGDHAPF